MSKTTSTKARTQTVTATALTKEQELSLTNAKNHLQKFKGSYEEWSSNFSGAQFVKSTVEVSKAGKEYARALLRSAKGEHYVTLSTVNKALASAGASIDDVFKFSFSKLNDGITSEDNPLFAERLS